MSMDGNGCGGLAGASASGTEGWFDDIEPEAMSIFESTPSSLNGIYFYSRIEEVLLMDW